MYILKKYGIRFKNCTQLARNRIFDIVKVVDIPNQTVQHVLLCYSSINSAVARFVTVVNNSEVRLMKAKIFCFHKTSEVSQSL